MRNRWKLEVCDTCGTVPCECGLNAKGPIHSILDIEHFDNKRFNPRPPQEQSAEELIAEYRVAQLAGV
jgi:hypothetical protein